MFSIKDSTSTADVYMAYEVPFIKKGCAKQLFSFAKLNLFKMFSLILIDLLHHSDI